jgi:S-adenosylmethionine-diacylgycerolhomoserine-N-methlytransferase
MNVFLSDLKTLFHLAMKRNKGRNHVERLENFYAGQADGYDDFRRRLLHGRRELFSAIPIAGQGVWVDLGGGTGSNFEAFGEQIGKIGKGYVVDLSPSLLSVAKRRISRNGWKNVVVAQDDAAAFRPAEGAADVVTFSYSLTMIPNWFSAVENAWLMLKPGGRIGVVDFYISRKHPATPMKRHGRLTRAFWPLWFGIDNVFLSPDHLPFLSSRFETLHLVENRAKVPYLPFGRAPYYLFIGKKPAESRSLQ